MQPGGTTSSIRTFFRFKNVPVGIYPLAMIMGWAVFQGSYFAYHCATGSEINWSDRKNLPLAPNYQIKQNQTSKLWNPNGRFSEYWSRNNVQ